MNKNEFIMSMEDEKKIALRAGKNLITYKYLFIWKSDYKSQYHCNKIPYSSLLKRKFLYFSVRQGNKQLS